MITSIHTLIYSDDPPATRAFLHDVVGWPCVRDGDSEPPWLIFRSGPSEMGVHPTHTVWEGRTYDSPRHHEVSLMCDDLDTTMAELAAKGATFSGPIVEEDFGRVAALEVPGTDPIMLYQPKHALAYTL